MGGGTKTFSRPISLVCNILKILKKLKYLFSGYICGREYGTKSLKIHLKKCEEKWYIEQDNKPRNEPRKPLPRKPPGKICNFRKKFLF